MYVQYVKSLRGKRIHTPGDKEHAMRHCDEGSGESDGGGDGEV